MKVEKLSELLFPAIKYYWCCQILYVRALSGRWFLVSVYEFWIFLVLNFSKGCSSVSRTDFLVAAECFLCQAPRPLYFQWIPVFYCFDPSLCSITSLFPSFAQFHFPLLESQRHRNYLQITSFSFWFYDLVHRAVLYFNVSYLNPNCDVNSLS